MDEPVTEYAVRLPGGGYHVRNPEAGKVYPLEEWIDSVVRIDGGKVYHRRVIVVEDWAEVAG